MTDHTHSRSTDAVNGFTCPHRAVCWQREAIRLAVALLAGYLAAHTTGCQIVHIGPTTAPINDHGQMNPTITIPLTPTP